MASVATPVPIIDLDLQIAERIEALWRIFLRRSVPQEFDVLDGCCQGRGRQQFLQELLQGNSREVLAIEHARQGGGPRCTDAQAGIEHKEAFLYGLQKPARLLARFAGGTFVACTRELRISGERRKRDSCKHSAEHEQAHRVRGRFTLCGCGAFVRRSSLRRRICVRGEGPCVLRRGNARRLLARSTQADEQGDADERRKREAKNARDELLSGPSTV